MMLFKRLQENNPLNFHDLSKMPVRHDKSDAHMAYHILVTLLGMLNVGSELLKPKCLPDMWWNYLTMKKDRVSPLSHHLNRFFKEDADKEVVSSLTNCAMSMIH